VTRTNPAEEAGLEGVGAPPNHTSVDRPGDGDQPAVRRARFVLADPELVAAEIVEANGARFAQVLAAELLLMADKVGRR